MYKSPYNELFDLMEYLNNVEESSITLAMRDTSWVTPKLKPWYLNEVKLSDGKTSIYTGDFKSQDVVNVESSLDKLLTEALEALNNYREQL